MSQQNEKKRNYAREMAAIVRKSAGRRPTVLLHSCCGPCSSSVLETLTRDFDVTLLWYNPNLYPEDEFRRRYEAQMELIEKMGLADTVKVLALPWRSEEYFAAVRGLENEPEGGRRCEECFRLRLQECARIAREQGFDFFCSTLTVSRYKNTVLVNTVGEEAALLEQSTWLPSDFKKNGGEMRSNTLSRELGIYRQDYCGCMFSLRSRDAWKQAQMQNVRLDGCGKVHQEESET